MVSFRTIRQVGATRFEQLAQIPAETLLQIFDGAESGARGAPTDANDDPILAMIFRAWPRLGAEPRIRVLEIIAAAAALEHVPP